jgi:hypothetical protein
MNAFHFLGFFMRQPHGNLLNSLGNEKQVHEVRQILLAY